MKRHCLIGSLLVFSFVCIIIISCRKNDSAEMEKINYWQAQINGALWTPLSVTCVLFEDNTYHFRIVDFTSLSSGKTITVELNDYSSRDTISKGTSTFADGAAFFTYGFSGIQYRTISGSVDITDVDVALHQVTGLFEFTVLDPDSNEIHITDGKFYKVTYTHKTQ